MGARAALRVAAAGLLGSLAVCSVQALARFWLGGSWVPELLAQLLFDRVPMELFRWATRVLGFAAKWVALAGMVGLYGLWGALLAAGATRTRVVRARSGTAARVVLAVVFAGLEYAAVWGPLSYRRLVPQLEGPLTHPVAALAAEALYGWLWAVVVTAAAGGAVAVPSGGASRVNRD